MTTPKTEQEMELVELVEKTLGFRPSSSGADMRIMIGPRATWVNADDAIALRDKIITALTASNREHVLAGQIAILKIAIQYGSKANTPDHPSIEEMIKRLEAELKRLRGGGDEV